ncbi:unnamed protein product [Lymnaea stagnalis]|uniref:Uncharacterized protein n=1 Tax=Lymnaea stagnalis TaxID=6523 RepID=A0AAV2HRA3_LYMST
MFKAESSVSLNVHSEPRSKLISLPSVTSAYQRPHQITSCQIRLPAVTSNYQPAHQITSRHIRLPAVTSDYQPSHQITTVTSDYQLSLQITSCHIRLKSCRMYLDVANLQLPFTMPCHRCYCYPRKYLPLPQQKCITCHNHSCLKKYCTPPLMSNKVLHPTTHV